MFNQFSKNSHIFLAYVGMILISVALLVANVDVPPGLTSWTVLIIFALEFFSFKNQVVKLWRLLVFAFPIILISVVQLSSGSSLYLSYLSVALQSESLRSKLFLSLLCGLLSCIVGLKFNPIAKLTGLNLMPFIGRLGSLTLLSKRYLLVALGTSVLLTLVAYGGIVSQSNLYTEKAYTLPFFGAIAQIILYISLSTFLAKDIRLLGFISNKSFLIVIFSLLLSSLGGGRLDFLPQIFFVWLIKSYFNSSVSGRTKTMPLLLSSKISKSKTKKLIILFLALLALPSAAFLMGNFRSYGSFALDLGSLFIIDVEGEKVVFMDAFNSYAGSMYSAILRLPDTYPSYLGFIFNLPPSFMGLPRFSSGENIIDFYGTSRMTQGSIPEPSEALLNLGYIGIALVPMAISLFFSMMQELLSKIADAKCSMSLHKNNPTSFYGIFIWISVICLIAPRAVWYQNFSFIRAVSVLCVASFLAHFLYNRRCLQS